ncbi:hypothetical protein [Variovorax sp. KBW07]|uniref:hypothetical protein n=1 Tax=Variovorax sp. KBW07 TaxID=2153358 RepID=UPI000F576D72|nr:hypothetical protein [Variovorax sp. KBW07]
MRSHTATFNAALLSPAVRERFQTLFSVAERKSVLAWQEAPLPRAEVVICDSDLQDLPTEGSSCTVFVGTAVASTQPAATSATRRFQLMPDFTVGQLLDTLDRAAVWLLEVRNQKRMQRAQDAELPSSSYQLRRWVTLPAELSTPGYIRAMALLTREPMSMERLCNHSGLLGWQAHELLAELKRLDVLSVTGAPPRRPSGQATASNANSRDRGGFFSKLSRWLRQSVSEAGSR